MLTIYLTRRADSSVSLRLSCPDSLTFQNSISALKFEIPPHCRSFDKFTKSWIIHLEAAIELERYVQMMVAKYCADVLIEDEAEETDQRTKNSSGQKTEEGTPFERIRVISVRQAYAVLFVSREAPFEIVQAAYRTLAMVIKCVSNRESTRMKENKLRVKSFGLFNIY